MTRRVQSAIERWAAEQRVAAIDKEAALARHRAACKLQHPDMSDHAAELWALTAYWAEVPS